MIRILIAFVASLFIALIANAHAASLEIKGAPPRAGQPSSSFEGAIEILGFEWGVVQTGAKKSGPGTITIEVGPAAAGDVDGRDFLAWQRSTSPIASMTLKTTVNGKTVKYKLKRCFVKSWSTSGDADDRPTEEMAPMGGKGVVSYEAMTVVR